jgi:XTP/dITP diphosphohydrolase
MIVIIATGNQGKINEIKEILSSPLLEVVSMREFGIFTDANEDGATFEENAVIKAYSVYQKIIEDGLSILLHNDYIIIADDSGLCVDYLNGAPGVYSARFAGDGASDWQRNEKLLGLLEGVPQNKRTARFICACVAVFSDGNQIIVTGECEGYMAFHPSGIGGFGYDPLFFIPEYNGTLAELEMGVKNTISHRGKAFRKLSEEIFKYNIAMNK